MSHAAALDGDENVLWDWGNFRCLGVLMGARVSVTLGAALSTSYRDRQRHRKIDRQKRR